MNRYFNKTLDKNLGIRRDSYYIKTKFGVISVFSNEEGLYIDLVGPRGNTVCLMDLYENPEGLSASIYADRTTARPTHTHLFFKEEIEHSFDDENIQDFLDD